MLVSKVVEGDDASFRELEIIAKPLLVSLSSYFSSLHSKFEFDDMYSICLESLYRACLSFNHDNPSFLSYAKNIMYKSCSKEVKHWNYAIRNVFDNHEISFEISNPLIIDSSGTPIDIVAENEAHKEFEDNVESILIDNFDSKKAQALRLHIIHNKKVSEIAKIMDLHYKNVHSIIRRGLPKLRDEYALRFLDK